MLEHLEKMREGLTKINGMDKIDLSENNLLQIFNDTLAGYTAEGIRELLQKEPNFRSVHDKLLNEASKKLEDTHTGLLTSKDDEISNLKSSIPRAHSSEEIQKKIDIETDKNELRFLKIELEAAKANERANALEVDSKKNERIKADSFLLDNLRAHVKDNGLSIDDPSLFVHLGEQAIDKMTKASENFETMLDKKLTDIASKRYGLSPDEITNQKKLDGGEGGPKKSLEEISKLPSREERNTAMIENGHVTE